MNAVFRHRDWLAGGYAVAAMLALAFAPVPQLHSPKLPEEQLMQLTLETLPEPEVVPVKPPDPVPPQVVPPVQPVVAPPEKPVPATDPSTGSGALRRQTGRRSDRGHGAGTH